MAIKVVLPTAFTRHTDGRKQLDSNAANLPGLLREIDHAFPALGAQIKDENGKLRRFINIYINDEDIRFLGGDGYHFQEGDEVVLIPSIAGGRECNGRNDTGAGYEKESSQKEEERPGGAPLCPVGSRISRYRP